MSAMNAPTSATGKGLWLLGVGLLALGVLLGRAIFPLEVPKPFVVEKRVEVPVERIVEKRVEVPVEVVKYVDRIVPVEKVVYRDREPAAVEPGRVAWRKLELGLSMDDVRGILGEPREIGVIGTYVTWHYGDNILGGNVRFLNGKLRYWDEPSR
jgi:hypothetical protein